MKRVFIILSALVASSSALAQQPPSGPYISTTPAYGHQMMHRGPGFPAPMQEPAGGGLGPKETIQQGVAKLKAFLASEAKAPTPQVLLFLHKEISPYFDFEYMTQLIIGPLSQKFNSHQRKVAQSVIEKMLLSSLANNLSRYRGGTIDYMRLSGNLRRGRVSVRMRIVQQGQYPVALELRIAQGPEGWKVYDVAANGISAVAHYRNYVRSVIQREGFEGAIQRFATQ